jgi:nitrous oxidase accessory protein NosD
MSSGSGNVFYGNYIGDYNATSFAGRSYGCGVDIGSMAKNNIFYHNNFVNNYQNLMHNWDTGMSNKNAWDNGEEGNYWSNYNSVDANGDGIGDTPFLIDHINVDHHPLMAPFDIESVNIEVPERANTSEIEKQDINLSKPFPTTSTALTSGTPITAVSIALSRKTPICQLRFISYL